MNKIILSKFIPLLFLTACGDKLVITERLKQKEPIKEQAENESIARLDDLLDKISAKASQLADEESIIESKSDIADALYNSLTALDLKDAGATISLDDSRNFYDFMHKVDEVLKRIDTNNPDKLYGEILKLREAAEAEKRRVPDHLGIRKLLDQIDEYQPLVKEQKDTIIQMKNDAISKRDLIHTKIDMAAKHFSDHFGDKAADLDAVILKAQNAKSLKDIIGTLKDNSFFSLEAEVQSNPQGPLFVDQLAKFKVLLQGDGLAKKSIIEKATSLKKEIDDRFVANAPDQDHVERLARGMDRILENGGNELGKYADTRGIVLPEDRRRKELKSLLEPGPPALGQPPSLKPIKAIEDFKTFIKSKVYERKVNLAKEKIYTALKKIKGLYDDTKYKQIESAIEHAADLASYAPNYQRLLDAVTPYTIPRLLEVLKKDGAYTNDDEVKFSQNFEGLRSVFHKNLFSGLQNLVNQKIDALVTDWKDQFKAHRTMVAIRKEMSVLDGVKQAKPAAIEVVQNQCTALDAFFSANFDCAKIILALKSDIDSGQQIRLLRAMGEAKGAIHKNFLPFLEAVEKATTKTEFNRAFLDFNGLLTATNSLAGIAFDRSKDYTVKSLLDDIKQYLEINPSDGYTYKGAIDSYLEQLVPTMGKSEINLLKIELEKNPPSTLKRHLLDKLSAESFKKIIRLYKNPTDKELIESMKQAAIADNNGSGIVAFEKAYGDVLAASDDISSVNAINHLATFFKDDNFNLPPHQLKTDVLAVAMLPGIRPSLNEERDEIKKLVEKSDPYQALKALAGITPTMLEAQKIDGAGPPPDTSFVSLATKLTDDMKKIIFGEKPNDVMAEFQHLKDYLAICLKAIKAQVPINTPGLEKDRTTIEPIVNAFRLVFDSPLSELDSIAAYDAGSEEQIEAIVRKLEEDFVAEYIKKFDGFKSVVGENELTPTNEERPIITTLRSISTKLSGATPPPPSIDTLINYIDDHFLQ